MAIVDTALAVAESVDPVIATYLDTSLVACFLIGSHLGFLNFNHSKPNWDFREKIVWCIENWNSLTPLYTGNMSNVAAAWWCYIMLFTELSEGFALKPSEYIILFSKVFVWKKALDCRGQFDRAASRPISWFPTMQIHGENILTCEIGLRFQKQIFLL